MNEHKLEIVSSARITSERKFQGPNNRCVAQSDFLCTGRSAVPFGGDVLVVAGGDVVCWWMWCGCDAIGLFVRWGEVVAGCDVRWCDVMKFCNVVLWWYQLYFEKCSRMNACCRWKLLGEVRKSQWHSRNKQTERHVSSPPNDKPGSCAQEQCTKHCACHDKQCNWVTKTGHRTLRTARKE